MRKLRRETKKDKLLRLLAEYGERVPLKVAAKEFYGREDELGRIRSLIAKGKGVRREAESEGSRRQTHGPRTASKASGSWMSLQSKAKSLAIEGRRE